MPTVEVDHAAVVRVVLGYLRDLNCIRAMRCLEEETGLVQGEYGKDLLFLRNLVLDGRWEDAQAFVKPFAAKPAAAEAGFDVGKVMFALRRQKFLELLGGAEARPEVMELVEGLKQLEPHCSKEEFNNLCYCLTLTTLTDHPEYRDWTPHIGRMRCFQTIRPYFEAVLARQWVDSESNRTPVASGQLLKLLGQAASLQVVSYVREHPNSAGPYHLKFDVYKSSMDGSQMVKRDTSSTDPPNAVLMAVQEWQRANVTAKPLPSRGGVRAAGAGSKLNQSAAMPSWNGAASAGPARGGMDPLLGTMPRDPGARPKRVRVRQRNPALARSMAGVVEDPRKTQVYQGLVGSGVAAALHMEGVYGADGGGGGGGGGRGSGAGGGGGAAVASAVRAAGTNAAPLSADEINTVRDLLRRSMSSDALRVHKQEAAAASRDERGTGGGYENDDATDDGAGSGAGHGGAAGSPARASRGRPKAVQWEISWSPEQGAAKEPPESFANRLRDTPEPEPEPAPRGRRHPPAPPPARASPGRVRVTRPKGWSSPDRRSQSAVRVRPGDGSSGSGGGGGGRMGGLVGGAPPSSASPRRTSSSASLRSPGSGERGSMRRSRSKSALRGSRRGEQDRQRDSGGGAERGVHFAPNPVDLGPRPGSGARGRGAGDDGGGGGGSPARRGRGGGAGSGSGATGVPGSRKVRHTRTALWDDSVVQSIKPQGVMPDTQPIRAIAFDPTGAHLVVGTNSRTLRVCAAPVPLASRAAMSKAKLNAAQPAYVGKLHTEYEWPGHHLGSLYCVAWSSDGNLIASGSNDTSVKVVRAVTWENDEAADDPSPVATFKPNSGTVRDVVFLPSGRSMPLVLSAGGGDCAIRCWHMHREPEPLSVLSGHSGVVFTVAPCSDNRLLSGSADGTACLWDLRTTEASLTLPPCTSGEVHAVDANPAGDEAAVGYVDGVVQVWDLRGNRVRASSTLHSADCRSVHYSPEGSCILTASFDGTVSVLRETPSHLDTVAVFRDHTDRVLQARWHPKSPAFATASADKTVLFWSVGVEKRR